MLKYLKRSVVSAKNDPATALVRLQGRKSGAAQPLCGRSPTQKLGGNGVIEQTTKSQPFRVATSRTG